MSDRAGLILAGVLALAAAPVPAQVVEDCAGRADLQNLMEPWEESFRSFSNGRTRVAALDLLEPATGWAWLLVLSPPFDETGGRQCRMIGLSDGTGFSGLDFPALQADYDPAVGLRLLLPVDLPEGDAGFETRMLLVLVNQSSGEISVGFEDG